MILVRSSYDSDKLKRYEVDVLDKFVSICEKNKIKYFLAYGTLLGAVRHKGFIPWDDDIDVYMKPDDYYKFKEIMLNNPVDGYFYQSLETEKYYSLLFAKLRKNNTSVVEEKTKEEKTHNGIFLDIFPLMPFPSQKEAQDKFFIRLTVMKLMIEADLKTRSLYDNYGIVGKILSNVFKIIPRKIRNKIVVGLLRKCLLTNEVYEKYFCFIDGKTFDKSSFDKIIKIDFEGKKYFAPKDYDGYLTSMYGDYMTPPPIDDRKGHSFISVDFGEGIQKK